MEQLISMKLAQIKFTYTLQGVIDFITIKYIYVRFTV